MSLVTPSFLTQGFLFGQRQDIRAVTNFKIKKYSTIKYFYNNEKTELTQESF